MAYLLMFIHTNGNQIIFREISREAKDRLFRKILLICHLNVIQNVLQSISRWFKYKS